MPAPHFPGALDEGQRLRRPLGPYDCHRATRNAVKYGADLIDMSDSIGTIEAGNYADVIAVDRSPLEDIAELLDVDFVMNGGKVYKD